MATAAQKPALGPGSGMMIVAGPNLLRRWLGEVITAKEQQGFVTAGLREEFAAIDDSLDRLTAFARRLADLPQRSDWPYVEPLDQTAIMAACDASRPMGQIGTASPVELAARAREGFLSSVCGCILGKPLEINPTLDGLERAFRSIGAWPLDGYVSEAIRSLANDRLHPSWPETVRERIRHVAADDDINYTLLGMLLIERRGAEFTHDDMRDVWMHQLPIGYTFGPERSWLLTIGLYSMEWSVPPDYAGWARTLNAFDEKCGAAIRVDAYGYACLGNPELAARLALRDCSATHVRTGVYAGMWIAALIAGAAVERDPIALAKLATRYVPQKSRFAEHMRRAIAEVEQASDWLDGYRRIHRHYDAPPPAHIPREHLPCGYGTHCLNYEECATMVNSLRFAKDPADAFCKQVMQGNDTDSFGARMGAVAGVFFGAGSLDRRWLAPFDDRLFHSLGMLHEHRLSVMADRVASLGAVRAAGGLRKELPAPPPVRTRAAGDAGDR